MLEVSEITLIDFGFNTIRQHLVDLANSPQNKELFISLTPKYSIQELNKEYTFTSELFDSIERGDLLPNNDIPETKYLMSLLAVPGSRLNIKNFKDLYIVLNLSEKLTKLFNNNNFDLWKKIILKINSFDKEKKYIQKIFDEHFAFKTNASPELKRINADIKKITVKVEDSLNSILQKCKKNNWLQDNKLYWQNGRTVLPVIAAYKRKIEGVIHGESSTNQTSFIEPTEVINLNNQRYHLEIKKKREENKILLELTSIFYKKFKLVEAIIDLIHYYDNHFAIANFAYKTNSIQPHISINNKLLIKNGINPIISLSKKQAIPLNIKLKDHNMVIITGPNAGGKTVVLKTIGLFCAMAYSGIFVPAEKIKLPIINLILADIGDRQSIENDLSTFSSHISNLSSIITKSTPNTLVLIDEIGTGTDPTSGAAISIAILEEILASDSIMFGSTHLGQIKDWANKIGQVQNARMIFDLKNLNPTFELELGFPGSSYCFEVAKKMGISQKIINKSKTLINTKSALIEQLVIDLEREKVKTSNLNETLINKIKKSDAKNENLSLRIKELDDHKIKNKKILDERTNEIIASTEKQMNLLLRDIHLSKGNTEVVKKTKKQLKSLKSKYKSGKDYKLVDIKEISIGMKVFIPSIQKDGIVETIYNNKKIIKVNCNGMKIQLPIDEITNSSQKELINNSNKLISINNIEHIKSNELDLRGCREAEAIDKLELFIDKAILSNLNQLKVIHGIGNGILKRSIHKYLSQLNNIEYSFAHPNSGGYGVTEITIKN